MVSKLKSLKSVLIVSYGPVPTPQYKTVEGGGMRAWGLAKGLLKNNVEVTVAINKSFPQDLVEFEGVNLVNWNLDDRFKELINSFDTVIISYCMGDPSVFVADNIEDNIQLMLDVYVPIYVEVSARESDNKSQEYKNYFEDIKRHNRVLKRGDYFLCTNQIQKVFYTGVLSSLGIINPNSYRNSRILIAPFGIHNVPAKASKDPYKDIGIDSGGHKRVLWFGGLYPWFRIDEFLMAVKKLSSKDSSFRFVVVGGKNPFNSNPDFVKQYEHARNFAKETNLINKNLFFVDWVDFDDRINWYKHADFVISINQPGEENVFSWRTRVMDYIWGEIIPLTNGGDPLSEEILQGKAGIRLGDLSAATMIDTIESIYSNTSQLKDAQKYIKKMKKSYYWENVTKDTEQIIKSGILPYKDEKLFRKKIKFKSTQSSPNQAAISYIAPKRFFKTGTNIIFRVREKGIKQSTKMALRATKNQALKHTMPHKKQYIFLSHPLDNSGAPEVLMQILNDITKKKPEIRKSIRVIAPAATKNRIRELVKIGVRLEKAASSLGFRLTNFQLGLKRDDFIFLNTVAIPDNYRDFVFKSLKSEKLEHAYWFIHEDIEQTKIVSPQLLKKSSVNRIHNLIEKNKLTVFVPSKRVKNDYDKLFNTSKIKLVNLRIDLDKKYLVKRPKENYSNISFLLSGTAGDGRKGQLIALAAFQRFLLKYSSQSPEQYREFSLHLVGINDDYISEQIKLVSKSVLGKRAYIYKSMPRENALEITAKCNSVICCSLNETFALYVAEGMVMSHIVLRNNSAGIDEQLKEGVNGYFVDSQNIDQFCDVIEKVLNKSTISDEQLAKMGSESQKIASNFLNQDYSKYLNL